MTRLRHNWARVRQGLDAAAGLLRLLRHLQSWQQPRHSLTAWAFIVALMLVPTWAAAALLAAAGGHLWGVKLRLEAEGKLGLATGQLGLATGQDEGVDVPAQGVAEIRRRYEALLAVALVVQNYIDDVASQMERVQHAVRFIDVSASTMLMALLAVLALVVMVLGLGMTLGLALLWVLRPPVLRDPSPPLPLAFFARLPAGHGG